MNDIKRALFIGRFQPFHNGHMYAITQILNEVDEIIIAVGSAQLSFYVNNPFTAGERVEMIRLALLEKNISPTKFWIIPVPDVNNNAIWVSHISSLVPHYSVVYSNNPLVKQLFKSANVPVKPIPLVERSEFSATKIRQLMIEGKKWEHLVPKSVAQYIKKIQGPQRLKALLMKDE
ncbi:MAG: nicotinamide-nucleotide adenylyltransferase [Candidatus Asgardarchaeia archaeon]